MTPIKVLWLGIRVSKSTHYKGWDYFSSTVYETGEEYIREALIKSGFAFTHLRRI
jgi:uncharacterized membrane protein